MADEQEMASMGQQNPAWFSASASMSPQTSVPPTWGNASLTGAANITPRGSLDPHNQGQPVANSGSVQSAQSSAGQSEGDDDSDDSDDDKPQFQLKPGEPGYIAQQLGLPLGRYFAETKVVPQPVFDKDKVTELLDDQVPQIRDAEVNEVFARLLKREKQVIDLLNSTMNGQKSMETHKDWIKTLLIEGEEKIIVLNCMGFENMPGSSSQELVGDGMLMLTRVKSGSEHTHRLHFIMRVSTGSRSGTETWQYVENHEAVTTKSLSVIESHEVGMDAEVEYWMKRGQEMEFYALHVEGNVFDIKAYAKDEVTFASEAQDRPKTKTVKTPRVKGCCEKLYEFIIHDMDLRKIPELVRKIMAIGLLASLLMIFFGEVGLHTAPADALNGFRFMAIFGGVLLVILVLIYFFGYPYPPPPPPRRSGPRANWGSWSFSEDFDDVKQLEDYRESLLCEEADTPTTYTFPGCTPSDLKQTFAAVAAQEHRIEMCLKTPYYDHFAETISDSIQHRFQYFGATVSKEIPFADVAAFASHLSAKSDRPTW